MVYYIFRYISFLSLSASDLQAIQNSFMVTEDGIQRNLAVTKEQFCELMGAVLSKDLKEEAKGTQEDYLGESLMLFICLRILLIIQNFYFTVVFFFLKSVLHQNAV